MQLNDVIKSIGWYRALQPYWYKLIATTKNNTDIDTGIGIVKCSIPFLQIVEQCILNFASVINILFW